MRKNDGSPRNTPLRRFFGLPGSSPGWWSVALSLAFFAFMAVLYILHGFSVGEIHRPQSGGLLNDGRLLNPGHSVFTQALLGLVLISAVISAAGGAATGLVAIVRKRDRSVLLFLAVLLGGLVLLFGAWKAMELAGR